MSEWWEEAPVDAAPAAPNAPPAGGDWWDSAPIAHETEMGKTAGGSLQPQPSSFRDRPSVGGTTPSQVYGITPDVSPIRSSPLTSRAYRGYLSMLEPIAGAERLGAHGIDALAHVLGMNTNASATGDLDARRIAAEQATAEKEAGYGTQTDMAGNPTGPVHDWNRTAGNVMSPINWAGAGAAMKATGGVPLLGSMAGRGAVPGAVIGATHNTMEKPGEDYAAAKAKDIGAGALAGALIGPAVEIAGGTPALTGNVVKTGMRPYVKGAFSKSMDILPGGHLAEGGLAIATKGLSEIPLSIARIARALKQVHAEQTAKPGITEYGADTFFPKTPEMLSPQALANAQRATEGYLTGLSQSQALKGTAARAAQTDAALEDDQNASHPSQGAINALALALAIGHHLPFTGD